VCSLAIANNVIANLSRLAEQELNRIQRVRIWIFKLEPSVEFGSQDFKMVHLPKQSRLAFLCQQFCLAEPSQMGWQVMSEAIGGRTGWGGVDARIVDVRNYKAGIGYVVDF